MRRMSYVGGCALSLALGLNVASADVVTVNLTGHVSIISPTYSGALVLGQPATATYSYETFTPLSPDGNYYVASPPASISLTVGGQTYRTQSNWAGFAITVTTNSGPASFNFLARSPTPSGSPSAEFLIVSFTDPSNGWPISPTLPTVAPPLAQNSSVMGSVYVQLPDSSGFLIQVDTATLAQALTVSPASSSFTTQQSFDAELLLTAQTSITSMQASVAGTPIPLSYPAPASWQRPTAPAAPASSVRTRPRCWLHWEAVPSRSTGKSCWRTARPSSNRCFGI